MDDSRLKKLAATLDIPCLIDQVDDLFYLTGLSVSKGRLFVSRKEALLFVDGRYYERAKKEAPCEVRKWEEIKELREKEVAFDSASVTYEGYLSLKKEFPETEWIPKPKLIQSLRAIKEPKELALLKKAADVTWYGYQKALEVLREGITEEEVALEFEIFCRRHGASGLSFSPIVAFGENSAYPHYRAGKTRLKKGDVVLIDVGAVVDQYHGDMTRISYFGTPDERIVHLEKIVRQAKKKAIDQIKPGVRAGSLDELVREEFEKANVKQLYIHSLGHGVGLETHEFPRILYNGVDKDLILEAGMVFTIEPGLYQPGVGGVRIEDMIAVTEDGYINLFADRP